MSIFAARLPIFNLAPSKRRRARKPRLPRPRRRPNPRASWPSWTTTERWTTIGPDVHYAADFADIPGIGLHSPEPEDYRPTAPPDYSPSPEAAAWNFGYDHGHSLDMDARHSDDLDPALALMWIDGRDRGYLARVREEAELQWARDVEADRRATEAALASFEPGAGWPTAEVIEAAGVAASRMGGAA